MVGAAWVSVPPKDNCLAVNLGEMLQLASSGFFRATPHRVVADSSSTADRLSLPFFFNPSLDAVVSPCVSPGDVGPWTHARAQPESRNKLNENYGRNAFKSLARSHPAVFQRHHPDLAVLSDGAVVLRRT